MIAIEEEEIRCTEKINSTNKLICISDDPVKEGFNCVCYHKDLEPFMARGRALKAEGKKFEYQIYENIPGGHTFDRIDTKKAQEIRIKIYDFLAGYLNPPKRLLNVKALRKAAYRY